MCTSLVVAQNNKALHAWLAAADNENGDDDDYDDGNGDDDEDDDYNGDENDMNGGLSYTCNVELKNMIMALRNWRVMETR